MHIAIPCLYISRKNRTSAKMKEVFIANSGKVLIRAADTGRLSRTGIQTETKANWQFLRQQIPADC